MVVGVVILSGVVVAHVTVVVGGGGESMVAVVVGSASVYEGGRMRRAAKRDANEVPLVAALRAIGCLVVAISGKGVPDLLVWTPFQRRLVLLEIKDGSKPPSARALTPAQVEFHAEWADAPIFVVASLEEALTAVGAVR